MANQNTGTPRFYIDYMQYFLSQGIFDRVTTTGNADGWSESDTRDLFTYNPSNVHKFVWDETTGYMTWILFWFLNKDENPKLLKTVANTIYNMNYSAYLGHNFKTFKGDTELSPTIECHGTWDNGDAAYPEPVNEVSIINGIGALEHDGFSINGFDGFNIDPTIDYTEGHGSEAYLSILPYISGFSQNDEYAPVPSGDAKIGAFSAGRYYNMPHSPELSLTMTHEYDGIKNQETAGGSTLSYANYYKPSDWGDLQAWQLDGWDRKYSGRRVWDLSFNHLSDSDIEPKHYNMDNTHPDWKTNADGKQIGNWFTNVINYTNGGQLSFIFCPDPSIEYSSTTQTIPEFAICKFDMKSFKRQQVANGVYNMQVTIREVW